MVSFKRIHYTRLCYKPCCVTTTDEHENACPRTCCAQFLIVSRNVNQLLRIFRIAISIYSRAIHVSFFFFFFFPFSLFRDERFDSKFCHPEGNEGREEGRKEGSLNASHTRVDDALRYVTGRKEMDEYPLDASDPNGISFVLCFRDNVFETQFSRQIALKIYRPRRDRKRLKKATR